MAAVFVGACDLVDRRLNQVYEAGATTDMPAVDALHQSLFVVDLHADSLLWNRDLLAESSFGHVDLPRLVEGNVALQVFAVVTRTPFPRSATAEDRLIPVSRRRCIPESSPSLTGFLHFLQLRRVEVWFDARSRALRQIDRMHDFVAESQRRHEADPSQPYFLLIEDAEDLAQLVEARSEDGSDAKPVGVLLAVEGAHWLGGSGMDVEAGIDELFDRGVRMISPTHRFNNALAASSEGCDQTAGLTDDGQRFLDLAEARGMVLDLAHASDLAMDQALESRPGPVVVSHTGVRNPCIGSDKDTGCDPERNLSDDLIREVAQNGGVIGIGYWPGAVGRSMTGIVDAFVYSHAVLSRADFAEAMEKDDPGYSPLNHIALGSDFDGAVSTPFDTGDLARLTAALTARPEFDADALRRIYGANACRVLALRLPGGGPEAANRICTPLGSGA